METKDKILIRIYKESKKSLPDMKNSIHHEKFEISYDEFKQIMYNLARVDKSLDNVVVKGKYPKHLTISNIENMRLSEKGERYVHNEIGEWKLLEGVIPRIKYVTKKVFTPIATILGLIK